MDKKKLTSYYSLVKNNLSVILIVPTLLGGAWQLLELASISTSFIRFFSITQLVADGILILFLCLIFYLSYKLAGITIGKDLFSTNPDKPLPLLAISLFFILSTLAFAFAVYPALKQISIEKRILLGEIVLLIPVLTIIGYGYIIGFIGIAENIQNKCNKLNSKFFNNRVKAIVSNFYKVFKIVLVLVIFKLILLDLHPYYYKFYRSIVFPENLLNKELLEKKIALENKDMLKPKLLYNNDKYLFYEIVDEKKKQRLLIVDFETLIYK